MVGTSSDVAFADAYLKGVKASTPRPRTTAALKNATVAPTTAGRGPQGPGHLGLPRLHEHRAPTRACRGRWTATSTTSASRTWPRRWPSAQERADAPATRRSPSTSCNRAQDYVHMFDPAVGFFQGRDADGAWRVTGPATTTRASGATTTPRPTAGTAPSRVPQDGRGLANLYGGRGRPGRQKLDAFFATPETAARVPRLVRRRHPRDDARPATSGWAVRAQQPALAPHPVHVRRAGQPWKTQAKVREALSRLYMGSEIGQGYPGDEDNGEMSAWYVFGALGFYPLQMGSPEYAIGSPLFTKATVRLENGKKLVIKANGNSDAQRLRAGAQGQRQVVRQDVPPPRPDRERRRAGVRHGRRSRRAGAPAGTPRRRRSPTATGSPSRCVT